MDILKAAVIAKFSYTKLSSKSGVAKIRMKGTDMKYDYKYIDVNNTEGYILEDDKDIIVVIKGSKELQDYIDSMQSIYTKSKYLDRVGEVHSGFYEGFGDIIGHVQTAIENTDKNIYFIGHSMGGSIAKLLGLYWQDLGPKIITFGEARSCKKKHRLTSAEAIRVVNNLDVVPYIHFRYNYGVKNEMLIYFNRKGEKITNPSKVTIVKDILVTSLMRRFKLLAAYEAVMDHRLDSYITLLS